MISSLSFELLAGNLQACPDAGVAIAASRWGATALLNLEDVPLDRARAALDRLLAFGRGPFGVKLDASAAARSVAASLPDAVRLVVLSTSASPEWPALVGGVRRDARRVLCECTSEEQVRLAIAAGADGVVAKGGEAGGHVGDETTFVLVQRLIGCGLPVWAAGGIGLHTAAACRVAGCAGIVIDAALALTRESSLPSALRAAIERSEGDDTACVGGSLGDLFRLYRRGGSRLLEQLNTREQELGALAPDEAISAWRAELSAGIDLADASAIWPLGQDASFAAPLARRYRTVAGVLDAFRASTESHLRAARELRPLAPDAPLARSHGTTYPILQGPMTRVSDTPEFADAVSAGGALPFLALALMRGPQVRVLLEQTRDRLGDRPWGVGILGFVPPELRQEQLEVVHDIKPAFALIAGGRPDQAASLEHEGIVTYLHVPSPGLLRAFLEGGARRFVFEGRECGGHVGPRSSFVLWSAMIDVLLDAVRSGVPARDLHVAFAGGVHDARSTAMVAALSAPLAEAGARVGVLIGTAYLFTEEAVASRAIGPVFQREALDCTRTVLFETAPGHAIRCADTPYFETFRQLKRELAREGRAGDELKDTLESLNLGRLRLASKGILREAGPDGAAQYIEVAPDQQHLDGMYMLGQVAALRRHVLRIHDLHVDASVGGTDLLEDVARPERADIFSGAAVSTEAAGALPPCDVAVVGAGCILPGAADVRTFWSNVLNKIDAITEVPPERFDAGLYFDLDLKARDRIVSKWGGFMGDVPFDPVKYGIPPSALGSIDSLQLLALEVVDQALSDAGLADRDFPREHASVIFGTSGGLGDLGLKYGVRSMLPSLVDGVPGEVFDQLPEWTEDSFAGILLNVAAGRVANRFNFGGVNYTVDAACASSLAAVQLGVAELQRGTSDLVVVGGIDTVQTPFGYMCFSKSQALSPRGRCRTFDQSADGIAISEGVVALVIKRLTDAERDGDRIYAVVKAVAGSSDGRGKGLTAPRPEGQVRALRRAYAQAGIKPSTVGLIEAHGTGTVAGDAAEVSALDEVFRGDGAVPESCAIGSVKSMIGHTKASAGVAGLLKAALALHHRVLPPTLHVETPNTRLRESGSPFFLNSDAVPWVTNGAARRAGVSSFGFGGTNFHAVLEEYTGSFLDEPQPGCDEWPSEIFLWGAPDVAALREAVAPLGRALGEPAPPSLRSLSSAVSRFFPGVSAVRLAVVASSFDDLRAKLRVVDEALAAGRHILADPRGVYLGRGERTGKVAFLFPGQGSQAPGMLRDLAVQFAEVRDTLHAFGHLLDGRFPQPLSTYIYPPATFTPDDQKARARALTDTRVAQPALGAVDTGLLKLMAAFGLRPEMVAGHSYGEYVALHAAGVIDETTLATLSEQRGRAIAEAVGESPGSMAAASADPAEVRATIGEHEGVWIANFNAPRQTIIAGVTAAVDAAVGALARAGISARLLPVACAFHTPLMHAARARFDEALASAAFAAPRIPVYSNTLAAPYPDDAAGIARILSNHLEAPVRFVAEIRAMYDAGARIFVEVGPRGVLTALARQIVPDAMAVALDHADKPGIVPLLHGLAQLAACGVNVDPTRLFQGRVVEALDRQLGPIERRRAPAWVVNGAGARPVSAPAGPTARPKLVAPVLSPAAAPEIPSANVARAAYEWPIQTPSVEPFIMDERIPRLPVTLPAEAGSPGMVIPAAPANATGIDAVMLQFQHVMSHFLNTQGAVMSAYLGSPAAHQSLGHQTGFDVATNEKSSPVSVPQASRAPLPTMAEAPALEAPPVPQPVARAPQPAVALLPTVQAPGPVVSGAHASPAVDFTALIVRVAAERTGYAPEMLDLDLGIEADLGIDSIKRVEILSSVRRQCSEADQQKLQAAMDTLTRVKTLREMAAALAAVVSGGPSTGDRTRQAPVADVAQQLLHVVSDRTGYPVDMLGIDLNIEADLGIDSIKRVEILTTFRQQRTPDEQAALHGVMDQLTRLKTLRELSSTIERALGAGHAPAVEPVAASRPELLARPGGSAQTARLPRVLLSVADAPLPAHAPSERGSLGVTLVTDDGAGTASEVCARLNAAGERTMLLRQRAAAVKVAGAECFADWTDVTAATRALARIREAGPVAGLLHLAPLAEGQPIDRLSLADWQERIRTDLRQLQILVQAVAPDLRAAGRARGAVILAATALGGDFGESGRIERPTHGGIVGYLRTAAIELPDVRVRVVDLEARERRAAQRIVSELDVEGPVEIGYRGTRRMTVVPRLAPLTASPVVPIGADSVVLLTGGARGITAELAVELASRYRPTLVLAGLSALSATPEDPSTAHLEGQALKAALAAELGRKKRAARPVDVDLACQRLVRQREIRRTIAACEAAGARVEYQQVDVRSESAVSQLLDGVYGRHRRLDVVVHGAGIIEDKLIQDKTVESFDRVVHTKADSIFTLMRALRHDTLHALVLMSSVTAAFGNRGQADYGAANGIYNAMAQMLAARPGARVVAMNWGPWDKLGMASEEVRRQFLARGITPIDPALGVRAVLDELASGQRFDAVVVLGDGPWAGVAASQGQVEMLA
ncbi:MAG TPA: SDR family NAD(P)-dependent oxidoreductase [Vicinamibacterales bacterium]